MSRHSRPQPGPDLPADARHRLWLSSFAAREYDPSPDLPDWPVFEAVAWAVCDTLRRVVEPDA